MSQRPLRKHRTPKRFDDPESNRIVPKRKVTELETTPRVTKRKTAVQENTFKQAADHIDQHEKIDNFQADQSEKTNETYVITVEKTIEEISNDKSKSDEAASNGIEKSTQGVKMLSCSHCEATFSSGSELRAHSWKKHRLKCKTCSMLFVREAALKLHMADHEEVDPYEVKVNGHIRYKCDMCAVHCGRKRELLKHMQKQHEIGKPSSAQNSTNQIVDASPEENLKCMDCLAVFNTSVGPKVHVCPALNKTHTCDNCSKVYSSQGALTFHKASHLEKNPFVLENNGSPTVYQCDRCPKNYKSDHSLIIHLNQHTDSDPFKCSQCEKVCKTRQGLEYHIRREHSGEKPHKCTHCHLSFISYSSLQNHVDSQHTDPKDFKHKCEVCASVFPRAYKLKAHISECHNDEKPFSCPQCDKQFSRQAGVKLCMDSHNKPYVCPECQSAFTQKCHLKEHINSKHNSERRYACETCMKCFPTMKSVKQHIADCHSDKRYICELCHQDYKYRSSYHRHMKTHKNTNLSKENQEEQNYMIMCQVCEKIFNGYAAYDEHFEKTHKKSEVGLQDEENNLKNKVVIIEDSTATLTDNGTFESISNNIDESGTIENSTAENSTVDGDETVTEELVHENVHVLNSGDNIIQLDFKPGQISIDRLVRINDSEYQLEIVKDPSGQNVEDTAESNDTVLHVEISENGSMIIREHETLE